MVQHKSEFFSFCTGVNGHEDGAYDGGANHCVDELGMILHDDCETIPLCHLFIKKMTSHLMTIGPELGIASFFVQKITLIVNFDEG